MGIDNSTHKLAFAIVTNGELSKFGEVNFIGSTVYDRIVDARRKCQALKDELNIGCIAIEKTVSVRSVDTAIKMAYAAGVVISILGESASIKEVQPSTWQSSIGNKLLTIKEKNAIKIQHPNKSISWYKNHGRELRKQKTIDWVQSNYGISLTSQDVADAIGIAHYAWRNR